MWIDHMKSVSYILNIRAQSDVADTLRYVSEKKS